ncbi:MAG TPA: CotH kinase family protein, partial [Verrucomicrobiae bacterium]|nr:CotH kinase family protein [Verrucomicrobiae bacterium]
MKSLILVVLVGLVSSFTAPFVVCAQEVRINEFMTLNNDTIDDEDGVAEDWIEIYNAGTTSVNLLGWHLTDATNDLSKWTFPSVLLAPNGYLLVFASNKNRDTGELHTNFRLGDGDYLALVRSNGVIATEFSPTYPVQAPDISYGIRGNTSEEVLLGPGAPARALVPVNNALEPAPGPEPLRPWTLEGLNESGWMSGTTGVGYDYAGLTGLNVQAMSNINQTVYIRIPFQVADPSVITALKLRMRYDDGMIAYLNGREVAWDNSPDPAVATWNSGAPANRDDGTAVIPRDFVITAFKDFLHVGTNLLAIQGLNNPVASSDLLILPEIVATVSGTGTATLRYFPVPTPGGPNNAGVSELGPIITEEAHHPNVPTDNDPIRVTARIHPARGSVSSASLHYRINFAAEVVVPFQDDGNSGDEGVGDGVYGALIPANASSAGQMVRWYITATDSLGGNSREPSFVEPLNSPEYNGTVVFNPTLTNPLPVLHWFIQNPTAAENDAGTRASIFYDGEFYDNVFMNLHGQSSRGFPKHSYDIDLHPGHNFKWKEGEPRADDINLLTTYPDKAQMRNVLAYETYRDSGNPYHWVIPVRVQQNGAFWGTAHIVENGDEDWLVRLGINTQGALYKMYNVFASVGDATSGAEKKTRKSESNADLTALVNGVNLAGEARRRFLYDNLDVAQVVNFLAARAITGDTDCCHKNYYFYRDSGQSDEWQMWPWDVDLSFGRRWIGSLTYWDQNMIPNTPLFIGDNNRLAAAVFGTPEMRQMYLRRVRTLMDELIKPTGTPLEQLHYEPRIDELAAQLAPDAALDAAKWNSHAWGNGSTAPCCPQSLAAAVNDIKNVYLPERRNQLYNRLTGGSTELPGAQPPGTVINFGIVEANPSSGNQEEEYIQLQNPNAFAVDISGWLLRGGIQYQFRGGTVVPPASVLYVAANRPAWRARASAPNRNNSLFVVGDYEGRLS